MTASGAPRWAAALRWGSLLAYLPLAHLAGTTSSPAWAAAALVDLVVVLWIEGLCAPRLWAWCAAGLSLAAIAVLAATDLILLPLLLVPAAFVGLLAWWFARSLRVGRTPLITRIVAGVYAQAPEELSPRHHRYTRRLTGFWAALLAALALANLTLALIAVPDGVLARLGVDAPVAVTRAQWSLFANVLNYGVVGAAMAIEYHWRKRVFPQRPYRNFAEFVRRLVALGPGFWRDLFR